MFTKLLFILMLLVLPIVTPASAGVTTVFDFANQLSSAKVTSAMTSAVKRSESGGVSMYPSLFLHPGTGDARADYKVQVPDIAGQDALVLMFSAALADGIPADDKEHPFDGIDLAVEIEGKRIWEVKELKEPGWHDVSIDMSEYSGKTVSVAFISNPRENSNYDWANFGEPRLAALSGGYPAGAQIPVVKGVAVTKGPAVATITALDSTGKMILPKKTIKSDGFQAVPFDFIKQRADSVIAASNTPENVRIYAFEPEFKLLSFGPDRGIVFTKDKIKIRATVINSGGGPFTSQIPLSLQLGNEETTKQDIYPLYPGEEATVEWPWNAPSFPQDGFVWLKSVSKDSKKEISKTSSAIAVYTVPGSLPAVSDKAQAVQLKDGSHVLMNKDILVRLLPRKTVVENEGAMELPAALLYTRSGERWQRIGSLAPLGKLWIDKFPNPASVKVKFVPTNSKGSAALEVSAEAGARTLYTVRLVVADTGNLKFSASADLKNGEVLRTFAGPMVLAGDGAFGSDKDEALFPGLEYLLNDERSSGKDFTHAPYDNRTVPHPNKITIPVMAVRQGQTLVSLTWDPLQKWDGTHDRPSAVFASPNSAFSQDNHLMGLFLPSVPEFTGENSLSGSYTAEKDTRLVLSGNININTKAQNVLQAILPTAKSLLSQPWQPLEKADFVKAQRMSLKSLVETNWIPEQNAWQHTNTGPVYFDPSIAILLWQYSNVTTDAGQRENLRKQVMEAVEKAQSGQLGLDLAMYAGDFEKALTAAKGHVDGLIGKQRNDGSWPYEPDEKHSVLGRAGDTSSGWTANSAVTVLRYARITGDRRVRAAGLKALDYLDTQTRPEGAQTWELQLHVPDILGSARITAAYLEGYKITGDKRYVQKASYWAKTGLPFVYLWNASDRNIMRYGTIPVFGATWFDIQPWFGVMVQWNGLEYAHEILELADLDDTFPWRTLAEGITVSAIQQQEYTTKEYPQHYGMYPDAYSPVKGKEEYHWDLNPRCVAKCIWNILGQNPDINTINLKSGETTASVSTVGQDMQAKMERNTIRFSVANGVDTTTYAIVSGIGAPVFGGAPPVTVDGLALNSKLDLSTPGPGFKYLGDKNLFIIKMENKNPRTTVEVHF